MVRICQKTTTGLLASMGMNLNGFELNHTLDMADRKSVV